MRQRKFSLSPQQNSETSPGSAGVQAWKDSARVLTARNIIFPLILIFVIVWAELHIGVVQMKRVSQATASSIANQVSRRLGETVTLLETLADMPDYCEDDLSPRKKATSLVSIKEHYNYLSMFYIDEGLTAYNTSSGSTNVIDMVYMQQLFASGKLQISDSFTVKAGSKMAYFVAVPIICDDGSVKGALAALVDFQDINELLREGGGIGNVDLLLLDSKNQIMDYNTDGDYEKDFLSVLQQSKIFGATPSIIEERLLSGAGGDFWTINGNNLYYTNQVKLDYGGWNLLSYVSFWGMCVKRIPAILAMIAAVIITGALRIILIRRDISRQSETVDMLISAVETLDKQIYQGEHPEHHDFHEILQLTSKGLSDGLTGVVTRSVFLNQAQKRLETVKNDKLSAMCFVDLDNLKYINDTYGHGGGDVALKGVGYILREFEKRYNGVVGRYGGDEFLLLLTGLESRKELESVLDEMVLRMHTEMRFEGESFSVQCSMGVAVCQNGKSLDMIIAEADEALYFVKQNGKGYYRIHEDGEAHEE